MTDYANDRHCTECIWHSETDGCWLWDCDQISRREAKAIVREWREARGEWIPVGARMPAVYVPVLVAGRMKYGFEADYTQFVDRAQFTDGEVFETDNDWYEGQDEFEFTHWMPLPKPPKESI